MCTVSVVPVVDGFRLMCNRDELTTRPLALPPRRMTIDGVGATFPIDPQSGGTWIGVNDAGLALALLNRVASGRQQVLRSRGEIVPRLIASQDLTQARVSLHRIAPPLYGPFRLVGLWERELLIATSDGARLRATTARLNRPLVFTSSSLGEAHAERLRLPLFETLVGHSSDPLSGQRTFHDHQWPACTAFSVRMRRADARTVSRTIVDVQRGLTSLAYEPLPIES